MALIALTTLARVKAQLGQPTSQTDDDALIEQMIAAVSLRIERHLGRPVESAARTEYVDLCSGVDRYQLAAYPVASIASVKNSTTFAWASTTAKVEGTDYVVDPESGILRLLPASVWFAGPEAMQVVYTGGIAANTAAVTSSTGLYQDLALACEYQVSDEYRRRHGLSVSGESGSDTVRLLPAVREMLEPYRRPTW